MVKCIEIAEFLWIYFGRESGCFGLLLLGFVALGIMGHDDGFCQA